MLVDRAEHRWRVGRHKRIGAQRDERVRVGKGDARASRREKQQACEDDARYESLGHYFDYRATSEESMKLGLLVCLAALLVAATPSALVAGSVHDQAGEPIGGARVTLLAQDRIIAQTLTASDGTFALEASGDAVRIVCPFCQALEAQVGPDQTVVAIVRRYDAPRFAGPSARDIAHLPYARAESLFALTPYVVLSDSSRTIPGVNLRDRGAGYGGLLSVNGVPDYDVANAISSFDSIPQGDTGSVSVLRVEDAYRYGNVAQSGTFLYANDEGNSHAAYGNDSLLRAHVSGSVLSSDAAYSQWAYGDQRKRVTLDGDASTPGIEMNANLSTGSGLLDPGGAPALASSFSSAQLSARARGSTDAFTSISFDRGTYAYTSQRFPDDAAWSDTEVRAGIASHAVVAPFALLDARSSSASYHSTLTAPDRAEGNVDFSRATGGLKLDTSLVDATLAYGAGSGGYHGIIGLPGRTDISADDAVFSFDVHPDDRWVLHASTSSGYTLQTILGIYLTAGSIYALPVERGSTDEMMLTYTDTARVTASVTSLAWRGASGIASSSEGGSIAWQVAPHLALRTWFLGVHGTVERTALVGSTWLSYDNEDRFHLDAIWGRDLLDGAMNGHLDGSIGGRLSDHLNWFAATEERSRHRAFSAGIQTFFTR